MPSYSYMVTCTCDEIGDDPCPAHGRENALQDELIKARNEVTRWKLASGLDRGGNPNRVTPEDAAEHWKRLADENQALRDWNQALRDWKAGAIGSATIHHPPGTGPHTKQAHALHKHNYMTLSEAYREGADQITAAFLSRLVGDEWNW